MPAQNYFQPGYDSIPDPCDISVENTCYSRKPESVIGIPNECSNITKGSIRTFKALLQLFLSLLVHSFGSWIRTETHRVRISMCFRSTRWMIYTDCTSTPSLQSCYYTCFLLRHDHPDFTGTYCYLTIDRSKGTSSRYKIATYNQQSLSSYLKLPRFHRKRSPITKLSALV